MDNIQLCYIDNEINKIDKMKQGDVIYKNGVELLVVLSYDHNEPCKGCFFYEDKACGSERLIKCWDCKKEYIFTAIRKYNTTELCGIVKRYEETILKTIKKIEKTTPTGFLNAKKYPLRNHELILIFSPMPLGKHTYNPQKTYGHVRKVSKASSKVGCKETELYGKAGLTTYDSTERYPLSVMTFKTDRQKSAIHPNQKLVELLRYLIRTYTNPGDAVMDPVAGSGTTGIAAYEEGRDSLLVEIDRQFFDEMINRFNNNNIKIDRI